MKHFSTIVQYVREGNFVRAYFVTRVWRDGRIDVCDFDDADLTRFCREPVPAPPGPLGYGRADLLAAGVIKPAGHTFDHLPFLAVAG